MFPFPTKEKSPKAPVSKGRAPTKKATTKKPPMPKKGARGC